MIVNVSGSAIEDYVKTAEIINELDKIPAIELNISCPNVKARWYGFWCVSKRGVRSSKKQCVQLTKRHLS